MMQWNSKRAQDANDANCLRLIEGGGIHVSYVIGGVLSVLAILVLIAALIIYR